MASLTVHNLVQNQRHVEQAWERFEEKQAAREAEIRRSGRKVTVMSDKEWDRIEEARKTLDGYTREFEEETSLRDQEIQRQIKDFFSTNKKADACDEAVSKVSESLGLSLRMYLQAICDPHFSRMEINKAGKAISNPFDPVFIPGYMTDPNLLDPHTVLLRSFQNAFSPGHEHLGFCKGRKAFTAAHGSMEMYSKAKESEDPSSVTDTEKRKAPEFMLSVLDEEEFDTETERMVVRATLENEQTKTAFLTLVKGLCMAWSPVVLALGGAMAEAAPFTYEGADGLPPDYGPEVEKARKAQVEAMELMETK
ncbi:hypothetical protein AWENTII_000039 [Aspergillus wentii]|nr:hypothetical protein MW887_004788 [Aspergillus wentii]